MMTPSSTFSQTKQKKSNTKVDVKGKKQKVFLSFPTIIPSSTFSERLLIFVLHHWSMIEMHSQAEAYTLHCTLLFLHSALFYYFLLLYFLHCAPSFFYTFTFFTLHPTFF